MNLQWTTLLERKGIDLNNIKSSLPLYVTSKEMNEIKNVLGAKAKDARFLAKMDCRKDLPEIFKENGLFLLPVNNGEFIILKGDGFCDIKNLSNDIINFQSGLDFDLMSSRIGDSEMQHLDYSFNSGLLQEHDSSGALYQTIRGRKRTPSFAFKFNKQDVSVKSVQIEVDGGYEAKNSLSLVEAKNIKTDNFVIRQLYYPFRAWKQFVPTKDINLSFFSHNNGIYTLHDFTFTDIHDYNSIKQLSTAHYRIVSHKKINNLSLPIEPSGKNIIPQADDLGKVVELVENIKSGIHTAEAMAKKMGFAKRQSSYYREAAEALGFVYMDGNQYELTEIGEAFNSKAKKERDILCATQLLNIPVFFKIFLSLSDKRTQIDRSKLIELILKKSKLNLTTAKRRSSTIISWLKWFESRMGVLKVTGDIIRLK